MSRQTTGRDRFADRRRAEEQRIGRRRLQIVSGLALVTSAAVGIIAFVNSSWFDVDEVSVVGHQRATSDEIVAASGLVRGQGLLEVDPDGVARSVEGVAWVAEAVVDRAWTGGVTISVVERRPAAVIEADGGFAIVDAEGRQVEVVADRPTDHPAIDGARGSGVPGEPAPPGVLAAVALLGAVPEHIEDGIAGVSITDRGLRMELIDGGGVDFGDGEDLARKLQAFETVLARVDLRCLDTIDVRVPASPTVSRVGQPPPEADNGKVPDSPVADC